MRWVAVYMCTFCRPQLQSITANLNNNKGAIEQR
jgi:hypothetical protein